MGSMFGGGGGGSAPAQQVVYQQPPAPGTLQQTIISGNPAGAVSTPLPGETDEERRLRLEVQNFNILGSSDSAGGNAAADAGGGATGDSTGGSDGAAGGET